MVEENPNRAFLLENAEFFSIFSIFILENYLQKYTIGVILYYKFTVSKLITKNYGE